MQKAETGALDAQAAMDTKNITKLVEVSVDDKNMVYVNWPVDKKDVCLVALCEALKLVSTYKSPIIVPSKPSMLDFIRGVKK